MSMVTTRGPADQGQQVAQQMAKQPSVGAQLKDKEGQFRAALPAHIPTERFMRVVLTAIQNNPKLAHADRASLWTSSIKAAQDGLLPDGREGALVIYRTKIDGNFVDAVQWMPMIAGIRKKVRNSGEIATWNAQVVYQKDQFEYELGDEPFIRHKPSLEPNPGPVIAAYSVATLKTGEKSREVMTIGQIEKVRAASRSKDKGPWVDWYDEMCRKTVARRHSKVLPMSTDLDDLIRRDDALYDMQGARDEAKALNGGKAQSLAGKLDAIAAMHDPTSPRDPIPAAGPQQDEEAPAEEAAAPTEDADSHDATATDDPDEAAPSDPREALLARLRSEVMSGKRVVTLLSNLAPAERELVTDEDKAALTAAQKALGGGK